MLFYILLGFISIFCTLTIVCIFIEDEAQLAAIVNSLSVAEEKLLEAKASRINNIKEIEATRLGPMSGVINFVGDYKQQEEK
mgnify:CR=1 FL=1